MIFIWIISATILVSLISLVGILSLILKEGFLDKFLLLFVGLSAGGLIGSAFIHILPEALEITNAETAFIYTMVGFVLFFIFERYIHWRHCHTDKCQIHAFVYLNLLGDGLHNFLDGFLIAVSFISSIKLGIVTTMAVVLHEIPQEIGDFATLIYGGFKKTKAFTLNFICALTAVIGAIGGYFLAGYIKDISAFVLPLTAGGFIYIAASDLIPELHRQPSQLRANLSLLAFIFGIILMWWLKALKVG
ncbi:MAG: ZIP family metal transporter [Candidatus Omnitrophota bacterium]